MGSEPVSVPSNLELHRRLQALELLHIPQAPGTRSAKLVRQDEDGKDVEVIVNTQDEWRMAILRILQEQEAMSQGVQLALRQLRDATVGPDWRPEPEEDE